MAAGASGSGGASDLRSAESDVQLSSASSSGPGSKKAVGEKDSLAGGASDWGGDGGDWEGGMVWTGGASLAARLPRSRAGCSTSAFGSTERGAGRTGLA